MVKTDGVQRGLIHHVIQRFEKRGFKLIAMKLCQPGKQRFEEHYAEHKGKPFFEKIVIQQSVGPVCAMVWEGDNVIATARTIIGATDPLQAAPGTIRGDFGLSKGKNAIHGSDSKESAAREIALWFNADELTLFAKAEEPWVYEKLEIDQVVQ